MEPAEIFARIVGLVRTVDDQIDPAVLRLDETPLQAYGLSSVARVQLGALVADSFGIEFGDSDVLLSQTPAAMVSLVQQRLPGAAAGAGAGAGVGAAAGADSGDRAGHTDDPDDTDRADLLATIRDAARRAGPDRGVTYLRHGEPDEFVSYDTFLRAGAALGRKLPQGATVIVASHAPIPALLAFFASLWAGARPLMLAPPQAVGGPKAFQTRLAGLLDGLGGEVVLALGEDIDAPTAPVPVLPLPSDAAAYPPAASDDLPAPVRRGGADVAFLQMTSASTGDAKLLAISHANAHANLRALRPALAAGDDERLVSWLPLHHDMGLVGLALLSFFHGWPLYIMTPTQFVMRPGEWIKALSRYRATITAGPNFGYDHAWRRVSEDDVEGCDLSALRCAVIGAEPIRRSTVDGFYQRFQGLGLPAGSLHCAYGMAESTLASTMPTPGEPPRYVLVDGSALAVGAPVPLLGAGVLGGPPPPGPGTAVFNVGRALGGLTAELVDEDGGAITAEDVLGEITLAGTSVALGCLGPGDDEPRLFPDGVLATGDLGFRHGGDLFVVERRKHVIIRHGRNHLAALLEEQVAAVLGRDAHGLAVADRDIFDPDSEIVCVVERCVAPLAPSAGQVLALRTLDLPIDVLLCTRRRIIPRTTSGKKKYHLLRRLLAQDPRPDDTLIRLTEHGSSSTERNGAM